jgi:protein-L-isoaspartate O-methyltransferase
MPLDVLKNAQIWHYAGLVILTDPPGTTRPDAVFPLCQENIIFVNSLQDTMKGSAVLDLCSGSGVLALFAARKGAHVLAVDANPRAVSFMRANVALNGMEDRVKVHQGDLFGGLERQQFQWILANPPFEPTGPAAATLHSDGGPGGVTITRRILQQASAYLVQGGTLQMTTYLPGDYRSWAELGHFQIRQVSEIGTVPPRPGVDTRPGVDKCRHGERLTVSLISLELSHGGVHHA